MRTPIRIALVVATSLFLASPCLALAQEPWERAAPEATDDQLIAAGVALRKQGQDAAALAAFERAYALNPSPRAVAQIALANQALAHWREAELGLMKALHDSEDAWINRNRGPLEAGLAAVEEHLGWLELSSNVAGAEVWIDGIRSGRLPLDRPIRVVAGEVNVEVRTHPYGRILQTLQVEAKSLVHSSFTFVAPLSPSTPSETERRTTSRGRTAGWVTLAVAGGLLLLGTAGLVVREWEALIYDDDGRCGPSGGRTRYERCGANRDIGSGAQTAGIAALVGSGIAGAASSAVLLGGSPHPASSAAAHWGCRMVALGLACTGTF